MSAVLLRRSFDGNSAKVAHGRRTEDKTVERDGGCGANQTSQPALVTP